MVYIESYGVFIPKFRIKTKEIARVWGDDPKKIENSLGIIEKAVSPHDMDSVSIGVEAAKQAIKRLKKKKIGAVYFGSESHPYVVKSSASIVAEATALTPNVMAVDLEFACRAATAGIVSSMGLVKSGMVEQALVIGADTAQGRPGDALEYSAGSGGAAYIISNQGDVFIKDCYSFVTDTPDFWRREGANYPSHGGRFTGEPAYFKHVTNAARNIMEKNNLSVKDFSYVVLHQPNAKFPKRAAKMLGFSHEQIKDGLLVSYIGNTYSAATLLGLANVLDKSGEGDLILWVSFGSGAGSDAFVLEVVKKPQPSNIKYFLDNKKYIDYTTYIKWRGKLKLN